MSGPGQHPLEQCGEQDLPSAPFGPRDRGLTPRADGRVDHLGHACLLCLRGPDEDGQAERLGHPIGEEVSDRLPRDPADQLLQEPADADGVVADPRARLPRGGWRGDATRDLVVVVPAAARPVQHRTRVGEAQHPRPVVQDVADEGRLLAGLRILRPVTRHRRVDVELAAVVEDLRAQGGATLGCRHHRRERVLPPRHPRPRRACP